MYNKNELIIFKYPYRISQNVNILKYINLNIFEYWYKDNYCLFYNYNTILIDI